MKKIFSNLLIGLIIISSVTQAQNNPEIYQLLNCQKLVNTGKSQAEKDELQQDYWTLLGIVTDLGNYRLLFLQDGNLIDLFPTAYYHTTYAEMQNLIKLKFTYPIETMKQMIAFYDAYMFNRILWNQGMKNNVEPHWREHFSYAESKKLSPDCINSGFVLSTGIAAHVQCDLPRAIRYSYNNRFDKTIQSNNSNYLNDFFSANDLFESTKAQTISDIGNAITICNGTALSWILNLDNGALPDTEKGFYEAYTSFCEKYGFKKILSDQDVVLLRQQSWQQAFSGQPLTDLNNANLLGQPMTDHGSLKRVGYGLCPSPAYFNFTYYPFKIDSEHITHATDKAFKWFKWQYKETPEDIYSAAIDMFVESDKAGFQRFSDELDSNMIFNTNINSHIKIASIDLDNNGICGLAVQMGVPNEPGFVFLICEDGYLKSYRTTYLENKNELLPGKFVSLIKPNTKFIGTKDSTIKIFSYNINKPPTPTVINQSFKIKPEWVTHPTDKKFKWYDWNEAPEDLKIATEYVNPYKIVRTNQIVTLRSEIDTDLNNECSVQIAAIDLNNDGISGIAIYADGQYCCGSGGCQFYIYENGGLLESLYLSRDFNLTANIISDLKPNNTFVGDKQKTISLFKYDTTGLNLKPAKYSDKLLGGKTPIDLGRLLFQALKTNNKKLWLSCIHPDAESRMASMTIDAFDYFRNQLVNNGIEDWNLLEFSRTTFLQNGGSQFPPKQDGNNIVYFLSVEFYNNKREFLGEFSLGAAEDYQSGNWFVITPGTRDFKYGRNPFK